MSNRVLTNAEMLKIFRLYEEYGATRLTDFLQMIWGEAYDVGFEDAQKDKPRC